MHHATQAVNHPYMVVHSATQKGGPQLPQQLTNGATGEKEEVVVCGVCSDPPEDLRVTACGHPFCRCALLES